ncbi:hypothetical protein NIES4073_41200 [Kalymmatonema gypsitolerans NIES-4073]|nr:hypothetical protein NIES4073_41200 [Scytonema sp. NIES-4073]
MAGSVAGGVGLGVAFGVASGVAGGVAGGVEEEDDQNLMVVGLFFAIPGGLSFGVAGGLVHGIALGIAYGITFAVLFFLGITFNLWRPIVLYPLLQLWNLQLYQLEKIRINQHSTLLRLLDTSPERINQRHTNESANFIFLDLILRLLYQANNKIINEYSSLLRYHSAFWDQFQRIPLYGLDKYLLLVIEHNPSEGKAAIDYLSESRQKWVVQIAKDALLLRNCADVEAIRNVHPTLQYDELESPVSTLLNIFSRISKDVDAALNQQSSYNQRLALKAVVDRLDAQLQNLTRTSNKYAPRFHSIAKSWCQIIANYIEELAKATELRQEIDSPYIIGVPLTLEQEIFTGRNHIGTRIEQLILDRRRPPLLLYGQRRMGKTSLLNNLGKLLPNSIIPLFVDLQGAPSSATNKAGFLYNLARGMITSAKRHPLTLPSLTREDLEKDPFTCFDEWLDKVEEALQDNTALLSLDEFEVLDSAISKGRFDEQDVLGMLRNLIQHRPKFKILIAGSHTIEEYQRWASYLINVQVVHISYLKEDEARQLIERPVKDFTLRYEPDAVERVLQLTQCHPYLVQLLCGEIVALKNEQDPSVRRLATFADVEAAVPEALSSGSFFFADIQNNQVDAAGLAILRFLAAQGEGAVVSRSTMLQQFSDVSESAFKLLLQRELIEEVGDGFRFQVELIRRWFVQ